MALHLQIGLGWILIANLVAFIAMWRDKRRAEQQQRRIPEKSLFLLAALGGVLGIMAGMRCFRHKTRKLSFQLVTALLLCWNLGLAYGAYRVLTATAGS